MQFRSEPWHPRGEMRQPMGDDDDAVDDEDEVDDEDDEDDDE
jgi:hypothetical protein